MRVHATTRTRARLFTCNPNDRRLTKPSAVQELFNVDTATASSQTISLNTADWHHHQSCGGAYGEEPVIPPPGNDWPAAKTPKGCDAMTAHASGSSDRQRWCALTPGVLDREDSYADQRAKFVPGLTAWHRARSLCLLAFCNITRSLAPQRARQDSHAADRTD